MDFSWKKHLLLVNWLSDYSEFPESLVYTLAVGVRFSDWTPAHASVCHTYRKVFLSNYISTSFNLIHLKYDTTCSYFCIAKRQSPSTIQPFHLKGVFERLFPWYQKVRHWPLHFLGSRSHGFEIWFAWLISSTWMNWCVAL